MYKATASENYKKLIEQLKAARIEQELSMRDLGELISEPHTFVQKLEAGNKCLDVAQFVQYCQALKVSPSEMIKLLG